MFVFFSTVRSKNTPAHRFIYECLTGERLGKDDLIDHRNGRTKDNTITNLVKSNHKMNARNHKLSSRNTSGIAGVREKKDGKRVKRWVASIINNEGNRMSACFLTKKEAIEQRRKWEKKLGGYNQTKR